MRRDKASALAVVGGGRWGRVIVSVLAGMDLPFDKILVVTGHNTGAMQRLIEHQGPAACPFVILSSIDDLLAHHQVSAAVVVNSARQHFETALRLIDNRVHVLIEKPVVLSSEQARVLIDKAAAAGVCLVPGLQYRFCSYIRTVAEVVGGLSWAPSTFSMEWRDQSGEVRYGEKKSYDHSINLADDVMPHVWAILSTVFRPSVMRPDSCEIDRGGKSARFDVRVDGISGSVVLEREATERRRLLNIAAGSGESLSFDFTVEPGVISSGTETMSGDPNWDAGPRPLRRQLTHFIATIEGRKQPQSDTAACLGSVEFAERASALLR